MRMKRRRRGQSRISVSPVRVESLEARRLLSVAARLVPIQTTSSDQIDIQPTYELLSSTGSDSPYQSSGPQGYTASQIRDAYGINQVTFGDVTGDGSGQTIAIIDAYNDPTIQSDLKNFDSAFGLANPTLTVVNQSGGNTLPGTDPAGAGNDDWEIEESLDVEWAHVMAPGAKIILVEASDSSPTNLFDAVGWARKEAGVSVISMSFGGNEQSSETQYDNTLTTPNGHIGITFVASAGDSGEPAGYPAFSPDVLGIGGTTLSVDSLGNYQSETGWSGSGGGISTVETEPAYQDGVVSNTIDPNHMRAAPDVSFDADPNTGVAVFDSYDFGKSTPWDVIGGTSLGAPAWAGIIAVADQGRVLAGSGTLNGATQTLPLIYSAPASLYHDITSGNNGFAAGPGYDLVTGRGSPETNLLIPYLVTGTAAVVPTPTTGATIGSLTANAPTVEEGLPLTLTANNISDPGGTGLVLTFYEETNGVTGLQTTGDNPDFAFTPITDGTDSITLDTTGATPGTYTFYAQITDSEGDASATGTDAPSVSVVVSAAGGATSGPTIGSFTASADTVVEGETLTLTATNVTDPTVNVRDVIFYEESNGINGLQTGPGGDTELQRVFNFDGTYSVDLDTSGVTGSLTFYALAVDDEFNASPEGTDAPSVTVNIESNTPPDAPTALTATAVSSSEIDLSFSQDDSGQTGFNVERATSPSGPYTQLFTISRPEVTTYNDTSLSPNTKYYYRVDAFDTAGTSGFSNVASATTEAGPSKVVIASQPTTGTAGETLTSVVVNVENPRGQIVSTDSSTVTLALKNAAGGAVLSGTLTAVAVNGVATFTGLSINNEGSYTLVASDAALSTATSRAIAVTPQLVFTQVANGTAGVAQSVTVSLEDANSVVAANDDSMLTLKILGGAGVGPWSARAKNGVATFNNVTVRRAGTYQLKVIDGSAPPVISGNVIITAAAATQMIFSQQPISTTTGTSFDVDVELLDQFGNEATGDGSSVTLTLDMHPAGAVLSGTATEAVSGGVADFTGLSLGTDGSYTLLATDSGDAKVKPVSSKRFTIT